MRDHFLYSKTLDYLKEKVRNFRVAGKMFTCPVCRNVSCTFTSEAQEMLSCHRCGRMIGDIVAMVRILDKEKLSWPNEQIANYLCEKYSVPVPTTKADIDAMFNLYEAYGFDLVPIQANGKIPIELEWPVKIHKDKSEWCEWLDKGANIGVKTGKCSGITILDLDTKEMPPELAPFLSAYQGLRQESTKGFHYFFQYDPELSKTRIESLKLDVENDGGQVVIFPSVINGIARRLVSTNTIPPMPEDLRKFLKQYVRPPVSNGELRLPDLSSLDIQIPEGSRTHTLLSFGGALRKELSLPDSNYVINILNKYCCKPSLNRVEVDNIMRSLDKYSRSDNRELLGKILNYLKIVGEASGRDCREITGEKKELVDKSLAALVRDGYITKHHRMFQVIKKAEWKTEFFKGGVELPFQVPFFHKHAVLNWGDLVVLGGQNKTGKTTISMNFVKKFVEQGIRPYYISLETGSRFVKTAVKLNLTEGDFFWDFQADPTKIELEPDAVTIIDWLMIEDKSATDSVMKYFVEQLFKTNGFLMIFMQLKKDNTWFAPNMVEQFPALSAKYIYDGEDGTYGKWRMESIREPRHKFKFVEVPCIYDFDTRILSEVEINKNE